MSNKEQEDLKAVQWLLLSHESYTQKSSSNICTALTLQHYNSHNCYVSTISSDFKDYRCSSFDQMIFEVGKPGRQLTTFNERIKHVFVQDFHLIRETYSEKLGSSGMLYIPNASKMQLLSFLPWQNASHKQKTFWKCRIWKPFLICTVW